MVYVETAAEDLIVLSPRWLCGEVLGTLLGCRRHLPSNGRLSAAHVIELFPAMDITDCTTLLTALELVSVGSPGYRLSCRNSLPAPAPDVDRKSGCPPCVGGVALVADGAARLTYVFPRVQHAVWNTPDVLPTSEWCGGIRFRHSAGPDDDVVTVQFNTEDREDLIRVICCGCNPQRLHQLQQMTVAIVLRVIDSCCPGVYLQLRALSPRDIREADRPSPRAYPAREVATAQLERRDEVRLDDGEEEASLCEVLAYGDRELHASLRPGVDLRVSELPMYIRCRLAALLDPPHPLGRDWLLLALGLGLAESVPRVDEADVAALSRTVCLLALWSTEHHEDATVRRLIDVVRRKLQRPDVDSTLLQLMPLYRPSTVDRQRPDCPSPGTSGRVSSADRNHSHRNSRKSSTTSV